MSEKEEYEKFKNDFIAKQCEKFGFDSQWFDKLSDKDLETLVYANTVALKTRSELVFRKYRAVRFPDKKVEKKGEKKSLSKEQIKQISIALKSKEDSLKLSFSDKDSTEGVLVSTVVKFKIAIKDAKGETVYKTLSANKLKDLTEI